MTSGRALTDTAARRPPHPRHVITSNGATPAVPGPGRRSRPPGWVLICAQIMSYDGLTKLSSQLIERRFQVVVLDEAHYIKDPKVSRGSLRGSEGRKGCRRRHVAWQCDAQRRWQPATACRQAACCLGPRGSPSPTAPHVSPHLPSAPCAFPVHAQQSGQGPADPCQARHPAQRHAHAVPTWGEWHRRGCPWATAERLLRDGARPLTNAAAAAHLRR